VGKCTVPQKKNPRIHTTAIDLKKLRAKGRDKSGERPDGEYLGLCGWEKERKLLKGKPYTTLERKGKVWSVLRHFQRGKTFTTANGSQHNRFSLREGPRTEEEKPWGKGVGEGRETGGGVRTARLRHTQVGKKMPAEWDWGEPVKKC